jgi:protein tyrosine/serine phosphatase
VSTKQAGLHARSTKRIILYVLILAGVIWTWEEVVKDRVIPKRWGVVEKGLIYRSGQLSSSLVQRMLERHGIKVIVDLTGTEPDDKDQRAETKAAAELGIEHLRFPLRGDGTGDIAQYAGAIAAVVDARRSGKPVLVHCAAGAQRTGGTIAFYRLLVEEKPPSVVVREMARYGWDPKRNKILLDYIDEHMGELAVMLQERGVIEEVPEPLPLLRTAE